MLGASQINCPLLRNRCLVTTCPASGGRLSITPQDSLIILYWFEDEGRTLPITRGLPSLLIYFRAADGQDPRRGEEWWVNMSMNLQSAATKAIRILKQFRTRSATTRSLMALPASLKPMFSRNLSRLRRETKHNESRLFFNILYWFEEKGTLLTTRGPSTI